MNVDIRLNEADYRRINRRLDDLRDDAEDLTPAMRAIAEHLLATTEDAFAGEESPDGEPWKPLAPSTARERRRSGYDGPILQRRRDLLRSIDSQYDHRSAAVGTNLIYAPVHQFGAEIEIPARAAVAGFGSISAHTITIPARPFLGFGPGDEDEIVDIIQRHLAE